MSRSNNIIKILSGILLAAIICYIGVYLYQSATDPLKTVLAVSYTSTDSAAAQGYAVRKETVLGGSSTTTAAVSSGVKVAVGEVVGYDYKDEEDLETAAQIRSIKLSIEQLTKRLNSSSTTSENTKEIISNLAKAIQHKDFSDLDVLCLDVEDNIFTTGSDATQSELESLQSQLETLTQSSSASTDVTTKISGIFSTNVDGFESINPDNLTALTPASLSAMFETPGNLSGNEYGKIITSDRWYFAAVMDSDSVSRLSAGENATIQFTKTYSGKLKMEVESIGTDEGGKCVVVFSSITGLSDTCTIRDLTANIIFGSYTGIRVPKSAVHVDDDGDPYVYILTGLQAEKVDITILCEDGDYYIVEDGAENGSDLRQGSEIITKADDLFDGKVVQ